MKSSSFVSKGEDQFSPLRHELNELKLTIEQQDIEIQEKSMRIR